jgi:putative iron-dependent peroxidase
MAIAQPGIFAQGTRSHFHLEFDLRPDADPAEVLARLERVRQPAVTVGGANIVVGFGADAWRRIAPDAAPADLGPMPDLPGVPVTQHDVWTWVHGTGPDVMLDAARSVAATLAGVATLALELPGFVYHDSRDLTGFVDGTENPGVEEAYDIVALPEGAPGAGGAHVLVQRWVHDLAAFHALPVEEQQRVIGRTKPDSVELDDDERPESAHIRRVVVEDERGEELEIYRRSVPYGTVREHGLYFVAFTNRFWVVEEMLRRMFGVTDGTRDRLTDFTRPVTGARYFAPSLEDLAGVLG